MADHFSHSLEIRAVKKPEQMYDRKRARLTSDKSKLRFFENQRECNFLMKFSFPDKEGSEDRVEDISDAAFLTVCESFNWSPDMVAYIQKTADLVPHSDLKKVRV